MDLNAANSLGVQPLSSCGCVVFEIQVYKNTWIRQKPLGEMFLEKYLNLLIAERTVKEYLTASKETANESEIKVL